MSVKKEIFGVTKTGETVTAYIIENGTISARVIDYGANLVNVFAPDKNGNLADIVLGFDDAEGYENNPAFFGALVGPSANRIAGASFTIDGREYHLLANDGVNNLHTDKDHGLHKMMWKALPGEDFVTFTTHVPDGMYGMPGDRYFSVTYSVTEDNALNIHYHATSDKPTIINLTNHAYWNLDGYDAGGILDTVLELHGSAFTPVVKGAIPTGEIRNVAGTVFDFTKPKKIGQDIDKDDEQLLLVGGYDHSFVVDGYDGEGNYRLAARACSEKSGRIMEVYTTLPGVQFYAGNHINVSGAKGGKDCGKRCAFALETQFYPDSIHHENFPSCVFGGERVYDSMTKYLFDTL